MASFSYFSEIQNKPVFDDKGSKIGFLKDLVFEDGEELAEITYAVVEMKNEFFKIPWKFVASIGQGIFLNAVKEKVECCSVEESELLASEVLMDRQLVDTKGLKIVRVNDVLLSKIGNKFFISSVAVGTRSLLRRLGLEKFALVLSPKLKPLLVPWAFVQPLSISASHLSVKLTKRKMSQVHPADIADLLDELSHSERNILFNALSGEEAAEAFAEAEPSIQKALVEHLQEQKIKDIVKNLSPAEIADLANALSKERMESITKQAGEKKARKISQILKYPKVSVGGLMKTEHLAIPENYTAAQAFRFLRKNKFPENPYYLYALSREGKLTGVIPVRKLLFASPKTRMKELVYSHLITMQASDNLKTVAKTFSKYHFLAFPVVDKQEKLAGTILMTDVFKQMLPKAWKEEPVRARLVKVKKNNAKVE